MQNLNNIVRKELLFNGIYKIINIKNNKFYIGSSSSKTFLYERLKHHEQDLINNKHPNIYLQRSFNKYGIENFYFEIIEICLPEKCIEREQYWIDLLNPNYNLCKKAGSTFGRKVSKETAIKISNSNKLFWSKIENKEKMLNSFKNRKKKEKKEKVIDTNKINKNCKKVLNVETGEIYNSVIEASEKLKMTYTFLVAVCNNKRKSSKKLKYI